tara:strand:- start:344 stop:625 length:282 start_codon:yes stop_codon:yes gene_type:complete
MDNLYNKILQKNDNYKKEIILLNKKIIEYNSINYKIITEIKSIQSKIDKYTKEKNENEINIQKLSKTINHYETLIETYQNNQGKINTLIENLI